MKKIIAFLDARSSREWGAFFLITSAAVLAAVFISQTFGFHPCKLCIWQRWPYAVAAFLSLGLIVVADKPKAAIAFKIFLALTFLVGGGIAFFHLGVEYKWWEFHSDCTTNLGAATSGADFLARLKAAPIVKCDDRIPFLFGMTMALYNTLMSAGLTLAAVYSLRSNSPSQYK